MQSVLVFLAVGLCGAVFSQQYQGVNYRYTPDELPLQSGLLVPSSLSPATSYGLNYHYAPEFSEFQPLVPNNFINLDYRFSHPPRFYYESTLYNYNTGRPYAPVKYPAERGCYKTPPPSLPPRGLVPGALPRNPLLSDRSYEPSRSGTLPPIHQGTYPSSEHNYYPPSYPASRPYGPSYRAREPPQVYETPPLPDYTPNPPLNPSLTPNIIRDDETSTVRNYNLDDIGDDRVRPYQPTEPRYEIKSSTDSPQLVTSLLPPTNLEGSSLTPTSPAGYFVPSLFNIRPAEPSSGLPPTFSASENPNIVRGETSPVSSTTSPNNIVSIGYPEHGVSELPLFAPGRTLLNSFNPGSSTEPPSYVTKSTDGLFTPKMFTPASLHPVAPESSPNREYTQPNILFEAPGHDQPK